jgi:predicted  nucleic acid-binding Zn ribbon protein
VEEDLAVLSIGRQLSSFVGARRAKSRVAHPEKNSLHPGCKLQVRILSHILKLVPLSYN